MRDRKLAGRQQVILDTFFQAVWPFEILLAIKENLSQDKPLRWGLAMTLGLSGVNHAQR